jgi:Tfp pilus assembly PilM family ATPase
MSQSIGIHLGERTFHVVALEGGLKKHKVLCAVSGEIPAGEGAAQSLVDQLRELAKEHKLKADSVYLAIDSGVAAFRNLTLPFDDHDKIEEVLKFEIEGNLPQFDIDQVVVDFLVLSSKPGVESSLLVTAVPKDRLGAALKVCERSGLEPLDAELEGTALFDAAFESGILVDDVGTVLIHVGDTATTVVVADGRRLASVRAIRAGASVPRGSEAEPADKAADRAEEKPEAEAAASSEAGRGVDSVQRIARELLRTLSGARTVNEIKNVYVCGQELQGLTGSTLLDVPVQTLPLTLVGVEEPARFVIAFGAALRGFDGGALHPSLRREELRFSGRFERLELPLAVLALLVFTLLFVQYIILDKQLEWRDEGNLAAEPDPIKGDLQIWLEASNLRILPDPTNPRVVRLSDPPEVLAKYAAQAQAGLDTERTKFEELMRIRALLKIEIDRLGKELGRVSEIKQPQSALTATTLVMDQFAALGPDARIGIRRVEANFQGQQGNKEDYVVVTVDADFYGATPLEATRLREMLESKTEEQPWCLDFEGKSSKPLDGGKGIQVDGLTIQVNVDKAPGGKAG